MHRVLHHALRSQFGSRRSAVSTWPTVTEAKSSRKSSFPGTRRRHTLYIAREDFTPRLQKRVTGDNLQETLQALAAMLDDVVAEPVCKDLARQRGDRHARALALEDVAEILEIGVAAAHDRVLQLEGGDIGAADDFVRGVHVARGAVCLRVADLGVETLGCCGGGLCGCVVKGQWSEEGWVGWWWVSGLGHAIGKNMLG